MLTQGIHPDVPMEEYIKDPAPEPSLSAGIAHTMITRSPAHAKADHPRLTPQADEQTARSELGTAVHQVVLGGDSVLEVIDAPDWRTKLARELRDAAREYGKLPLLAHQVGEIMAIAESAKYALSAAGVDLASARREHTMIWQDGGTWCRGRPDILVGDLIIDLKTATNAEPSAWLRTAMLPGGYHMQAAHYLRGVEVLEGRPRRFVFCVVEIKPPYACSLVGVGPAMLDFGQQQHRAAMGRWRECIKSGEWPGYRRDIHWVEPPAYATFNWMMQQENPDPSWMTGDT